jgi:hypothetical protein
MSRTIAKPQADAARGFLKSTDPAARPAKTSWEQRSRTVAAETPGRPDVALGAESWLRGRFRCDVDWFVAKRGNCAGGKSWSLTRATIRPTRTAGILGSESAQR